jgi:DNA-binding NarL/FixJ family response regulator
VPENTTVLVADPSRETRQLLSDSLSDSGFARVIVAESIDAVEDVIATGRAGQLALVSLAFGGSAGRLINRLREANWARVVALAPTPEVDALLDALSAGASGVLRGHPHTPPTEFPRLIHELSERELQVLTDVAEGRSNKWIGEHLSLSALTVKSHLARISRKLGTGDRAHMVAIVMRAGLID